jgi:hypothetical protein
MENELASWENEGGMVREPKDDAAVAESALKRLMADVTEDAREEDSPEVFA